jgi:hypothetical protein
MAVELHVDMTTLAAIVARSAQVRMHSLCMPASQGLYLDHADVVEGEVRWSFPARGPQLALPIDVFVVRRDELVAAPNTTPAGATRAAGRVTAVCDVWLDGLALTFQVVDVDFGVLAGSLGDAAGPVEQAFIAAVGSVVRIDLSSALRRFGVESPRSTSVEAAGRAIAVRVDATLSPVERLQPGEEWCLFLDGAGTEALALSYMPNQIPNLTSMSQRALWKPVGDIPRVIVELDATVAVPDPFGADVHVRFHLVPSLVPGAQPKLRAQVEWEADVNLAGFPGALLRLEDILSDISPVPGPTRELIKARIEEAMDPRTFGAVPTGPRHFRFDSDLPLLDFAGSRFHLERLGVIAGGMSIGGAVALPVDVGKRRVVMETSGWSNAMVADTFCSRGDSAGDTPHAKYFRTAAGVSYSGGGRFCEAELLTRPDELAPFLRLPKAPMFEQPGGDGAVSIVMNVAVANKIGERVQLILRTARGVRCCDLGPPPHVTIRDDGTVQDGVVIYNDDCLREPPPMDPDDPFYAGMTPEQILEVWDRWSGVWSYWWGCPFWLYELAAEAGIDMGEQVSTAAPPDMEWERYLAPREIIEFNVIEITDLDPGEPVEYRTSNHEVLVVADQTGRAILPAVVPVERAAGDDRAVVARLNRASLAGKVTARSAVFVREVDLQAGLDNVLSVGDDGGLRVTGSYGDYMVVNTVQESDGEVSVNRISDAPPDDAGRPRLEVALPGVVEVLSVPGFNDAPVALARMHDGNTLVLDLAGTEPRVAGTFRGPIGVLDVQGGWAAARTQDHLSVFRHR